MRLDSPIHTSYYRYGLWGVFLLSLLILAIAGGLHWWQNLITSVVFVVLIYSELTKPDLLHIVSNDGEWQFLVHTSLGDELWRGQVLIMDDFGLCVVLRVNVELPTPKTVKWVIFQDMLEMNDYRQLRSMSRFYC